MLVKTFGGAVNGIDARIITVETDIVSGVNFFLVGLPDSAVKESQQRIESALRTVGYQLPGRKITINMAPADIRKEGTAYDLTLAIGILAASKQIQSENVDKYIMMGELSLDGGVHRIKGALSMAIEARKFGFKGFILSILGFKSDSILDSIHFVCMSLKLSLDISHVVSHSTS